MKSQISLSCIFIALAGVPTVRGQSITPSVINSSGGSGVIGGNTYEWSVGEIMVSTFTTTSLIVTQGVLQPKPASAGLPQVPVIQGLSVFPNPSSAIVNIRYDAPASGSITCRLMDVAGRMLITNSYDTRPGIMTWQMDISHLPCASYMLQVTYKAGDAAEQAGTYKIQKLN